MVCIRVPFPQARRHGGHSKAVSPKRELCPKKVTGSVPLECSSRPETPKILVITPEFVSKNCFFAVFAIKTYHYYFLGGLHPRIRGNSRIFRDEDLFFVFTPELGYLAHILQWRLLFFGLHSRIPKKKVFVPSQKLFMPPPPGHAALAPGLLFLHVPPAAGTSLPNPQSTVAGDPAPKPP